MAICGKDCSFSIDGAAVPEGSEYSIDITRDEQDVTPFGGDEMGNWLACRRNGVVTLNSFADVGIDDGDTIDLLAVEGSPAVVTHTMQNAVCTGARTGAPVAGVVTYDYTFRLTKYVKS